MKLFHILVLLLFTIDCQSQVEQAFNLGFERQKEDAALSEGWFKWGTYPLSTDTLSYAGHRSAKITSDGSEAGFGSIAYKVPAVYKGEKIRLEGYMKIKNVEGGFAGLLLRIDGPDGSLAFDNMQNQGIKGTREWQMYSITLDYPEDAETIYVAGIMVGKGEAWFDEFSLTIDGQNVESLQPAEKVLLPAQLDKEFDEGSSIEITGLSEEHIEDLNLLGRVWGFLKYHHPEIAKGNYNWDYELFRFLPGYLNTSGDIDARNALLIDWIDSLGEIEPCVDCADTDENAFLQSDMSWVEKYGTGLQEKLLWVYQNRNQGTHFYIRMFPQVGNPDFKNESGYANMTFPDDGYRLLALFRYWNMIQYFFPYRHLMDTDWNVQLERYIPIFMNASTELEYELAALQLIGEIQDTHANLWGGGNKIEEWKGQYYPPFHLRFRENKLVVTDFYNPELRDATGLEIGDVITKIKGQSISTIVENVAKYYPASNTPTRLRDIARHILRAKEQQIEISYIGQEGLESSLNLALYPRDSLNIYGWYPQNDDLCYKMLSDNIGYVTLQSIKEEDIPEIKKRFRNTKGIIIDIRNYPSTFVPFSLGSYFVSSPTPFVKFTDGEVDNPGQFTFTEKLEIPSNNEHYRGKLVVLLNELSQSQAEYTAMAFRAGDNTTVIGSTTAGADGNVSTILLPGGLRTMISGIGVYYPDGTETQRVGIIPDIVVHPTIEGIRQGKDELLTKAIEIILKD